MEEKFKNILQETKTFKTVEFMGEVELLIKWENYMEKKSIASI